MPITRIDTPAVDLPLRSVAGTRALEACLAAALPPHALMRRAGAAVARLAGALAPHAACVRVYAGPGNNGGDGFEAACELRATGRDVEVVFVGAADRLPADAAAALARARAAGITIVEHEASVLTSADLAIDGLLGIGARRAAEGALATAIDQLARLPCPVLAIDLPSGLDADTGQPLGTACVRADHTLALLTLKPGLFTAAGRASAGTVWFDDLDAASVEADLPAAWLAGATRAGVVARRHDQHKGSFGDLAVVGGAPGMRGATLLAARAAHAAGAGRVFVECLGDAPPTLDPDRPELMFRPHWSASAPEVLAAATVVCGCGGGSAVRAALPRLLSLVPRLVLDADALNAIAADTGLQTQLQARATRGHTSVLTPHPLEAARLLGTTTAEVQSDRLAAARALADRFGGVVLLKGSGSVVAVPGRVPWINPTGSAALASAGTGDVLAGWIGGLWAPQRHADAALACTLAAAWQHGHAADTSGRAVMRAAELVERLAAHQEPPPAAGRT